MFTVCTDRIINTMQMWFIAHYNKQYIDVASSLCACVRACVRASVWVCKMASLEFKIIQALGVASWRWQPTAENT